MTKATFTKTDAARIIVMALYNMPSLPGPTHFHVRKLATLRKDSLQCKLRLAENALTSIGREIPNVAA